MALIQKTLFPENLDRYNVFVQDTSPNSRYFNITELPDTFTGGKNAFLIAGSSELVADTLIKIEIKDAAGNIIYYEPGEGSMITTINGDQFTSEYYEGVSKVVSVYVYPGDTAYGPCTITILGELSSYYDNNGLLSPIPLNWEGQYNVKWQKTINVNPTLANTTKIRFYRRPTVSINELISPVYRIENGLKINTGINQSFANIKLSNLETFAGDVKRIKVFRTSLGDISDYDMIQDILVESKELLTSYDLSGSVVGNTGILTSETFKSYWNTGSLNATLDSTRVEAGVNLKGAGNFTYSASLELKSTNTYELNLDAFYSASTPSNLGIYILSGSTSSSIGTLNGISPTKNLLDTTIPFKLDKEFSPATLYFSQSQGEWDLGNISLRLSEDTAFSPDEVSFVTTMPTVVGNEDYNFKFEFYDVNSNYVPVIVTGSANFTGGSNTITKLLTFESDRTAFRFSTGSYANPPNQTVKFKTIKTNFTGSITYASSAFDVGGTYIQPTSYAGTYPGWFTSQNDNGALLNIASFSGSVSSVLVGSIVYTASCEGFEEYETIYRFEDGDNAPGVFVTANTNQFIYKATDLSINPAGQVITLEAKRKNLASATTPLTVNSGSGKPPLTLVSTNAVNGVDTYTLAGSSYTYGVGESIYYISGSDQFGNEFSDAIKITPVKILDGLSVTLTNDNASLPALSNGFVASGSFLLTSGSVTVKVGNESISFDDDNDSVRANNTFAITDVTGIGCTPNTGNNSNPSTNQYGITTLTSDSGSLNITISYKDGAGDTTSIVKTATYTKNKKAAPVLRLEATPKDQSVSAKSTGEQVDSFSNVTISVKETYNGSTSNLTITSLTATSSDIASISTTPASGLVSLNGKTLANGTNATTIAISVVVTDSEGVSRTVTDTLSLSKVKKATPNVEGQISPTAQTVTANSDGTNPATPTSLTVKALEGGTTRLTSASAVGVGVTIGTIAYNGTSPYNYATIPLSSVSSDTATITVTINYTDSEGNTGSKTAIATISKAKKASPVVVISANPQSQTVPATAGGVYSTPSTIAISVNEGGTAYTYATSGNNTFQITAVTGGTNASGVITPTTPTSVAGTSGVVTLSYINSEGTSVTGKTINFNVGVAAQGGAGADGGAGPGVVYRGVWANGVEYYKTATRVDVVSYLGSYYLATLTHTSATGNATTGQPGVGTRWTAFGAQFSSVATDVLLAQDATITRGLVMGTLGSDSGFIRSANATSLTDGTGFYLNVDGKVRFGNPSGGRVYWDGNTLSITGTINANAGTFSGDITSTATISGGTISGGTISGGTIAIGSGNNIFKADATNGISLGHATPSSAPFRVSIGGALTASSANITGVINATSGNFSGNITSTATITGGTIIGGAIQGGAITGASINIGGNFSVNSLGNLTANDAILSGSISATAGTIGGFSLSNSSLTTLNGKLKLDTSAPAILLFESVGGSPKVEINAANTLTNPGNSNVYPQWAGGQVALIGTEGNRTITENTSNTTTDLYGTISDETSIPFSGLVNFSVYTPDLVISVNAGTISAGSSYPPYQPRYDGDSYQSQYASPRRASAGFVLQLLDTSNNIVATSAEIGPSVYANGASTNAYYYSDDGTRWLYSSYTQAASATPRQSFTNRFSTITIPAAGTYKVRMVLRVNVSAGLINNYDNNTIQAFSTTATTNHSFAGASPSFTPNLNKLEITNAGIQVITTSDSYVKIQRNSDSGWSGGTLFQAVGGVIRGQAYGAYPTYFENYGMNIDGYVNLNGTSYNTIGTTNYDSDPAPQFSSYNTVLEIKGRYAITGSAKQSRVNVQANIYPYTDDRYNLGGPSDRWRDIYTNGAVTTTSDRTKKTNITLSNLGLDFINKLTPVSYTWITGSVKHQENWPSQIEKELKVGDYDRFNNIVTEDRVELIPNPEDPPIVEIFSGKRTHYGLIAQDVKSVIEDIGLTTKDFAGYVAGDVENDTELGLRYDEFVSPMIKAIQELSAKVNELEAKLSGSI